MFKGEPVWNSLEIAKLAVGVLTPVAIVFLGTWLTRQAKSQELRNARQSAVIQKRVELWGSIASWTT